MSKTVLVTGGTRGIGHAISAAMAKAGYKVAANYAGNDEAAKATADELGMRNVPRDGEGRRCGRRVDPLEVEAPLVPVPEMLIVDRQARSCCCSIIVCVMS